MLKRGEEEKGYGEKKKEEFKWRGKEGRGDH